MRTDLRNEAMNLIQGLRHTRIFGLVVTILLLSQLGFSAPVQAQAKVSFFSFDFTVIKSFRGYPGAFPIRGQPISSPHTVKARLSGPNDTATFRLVEADDEDETLLTIDLVRPIKEKDPGYFTGTIEIPDEPFRVAVNGVDLHGRPFNLIFPKIFRRQSLEVSLGRSSNEIKNGQTGTLIASVTNHGVASTIRMEVTVRARYKSNSLNFDPVSRVAPASLSLGAGETGAFEVDITIPQETTGADSIILTATAISTSDSKIQNFSERYISFEKPTSFSLSPEIYRARIKVHPKKGSFEIHGHFILDPESDGINPITDEIKVYVRTRSKGPVETLIPGSFVEKRKKFFYLQKGKAGINRMVLKKDGRFEIEGKGLDTSMMQITEPLSLSLSIGNDSGTKVVYLQKRGKNRGVFVSEKSKD